MSKQSPKSAPDTDTEDEAPRAAPPARQDDDFYVMDTTVMPATERIGVDGKVIQEGGVKIHEQWVGDQVKPFRFEYAKPTKMPKATAMKFLKHQGFVVTDSAGNKITPLLPEPDGLVGKKPEFRLSFDQTIAELRELNMDALLKRAWQLPDGDQFKADSSPQEVAAFIIHTRKARAKKNAGPNEAKKDAQGMNAVPMSAAEEADLWN